MQCFAAFIAAGPLEGLKVWHGWSPSVQRACHGASTGFPVSKLQNDEEGILTLPQCIYILDTLKQHSEYGLWQLIHI